MKFLIDAQLPPSLKKLFISKGYDCIHTLDLEKQHETSDDIINSLSVVQQRIVITKDADFLNSFTLKKEPYKLILVKLGNSSKKELLNFFTDKFDEIIEKITIEQIVLLMKE